MKFIIGDKVKIKSISDDVGYIRWIEPLAHCTMYSVTVNDKIYNDIQESEIELIKRKLPEFIKNSAEIKSCISKEYTLITEEIIDLEKQKKNLENQKSLINLKIEEIDNDLKIYNKILSKINKV